MTSSLTRRLQSLLDTYKTTLTQIQQLQSLPPTTPDTDRLDLANDIHESLRDQEDTLELLRQELDDEPSHTRRTSPSHHTEHDRNADLIARLTEDLRSARTKYRRAQLQAKRTADDAKRKEREALFKRSNHNAEGDGDSNPTSLPQHGGRRPGQEKLTQEEIARNASKDVTRALRRTHDLMTANLQQSQFAQQTLDESQDALKGLADSYGGTSDLLKNSRSLVGQLVRSNKSDTWYLQTAFYLLAVTIAWLVFRRLLYGPLWWLVWQPLRLMWWTTMGAFGMVGVGMRGGKGLALGGESGEIAGSMSIMGSGEKVEMNSPAKGVGWDGGDAVKEDGPPMVEEVGKMAQDAKNRETNVDDITDEERRRQEDQPRNPKKRMMEAGIDADKAKDEL